MKTFRLKRLKNLKSLKNSSIINIILRKETYLLSIGVEWDNFGVHNPRMLWKRFDYVVHMLMKKTNWCT